MANVAIDQISDWGVGRIAATLGAVTSRIVERAAELGWVTSPTDERSLHLIGIRRPEGLPDGLSERLVEANVSVSVRGDSVRIAPHLHTTPDDVDRLLAILQAL
jgi:selenocysteine lyase/cysteine desulfurase